MTTLKSQTHQALEQVIIAHLNIKPDDFSNLIMSYLKDDDFIEERSKYHHDVVMEELIGCDKSLKNYYGFVMEEETKRLLQMYDIDDLEELGRDVDCIRYIRNNVGKRSRSIHKRIINQLYFY
jgi:hypothetical protein